MITTVSFFIMGLFSVFLGITTITRKWPVTAAMLLIVFMMVLAGMYGLLGAHFSAVSQIIVYAGAIMVIFVFVIMLLNLPQNEMHYGYVTWFEYLLVVLGVLVALFFGTKIGQGYLGVALGSTPMLHARAPYYPEALQENAKNVAALMFTDYLWAFELVSFLILAAIVGSVVIAKKEKEDNHAH